MLQLKNIHKFIYGEKHILCIIVIMPPIHFQFSNDVVNLDDLDDRDDEEEIDNHNYVSCTIF